MIKINLIPKKKQLKMPSILWFDFSQLNLKMIIVAVIISKVPDFTLHDYWKNEMVRIDKQYKVEKKHISKYRAELKNQNVYKKQMDSFLKQEKKLQDRLAVVKKIIKIKQSPYKLLQYISKNIPENVWLKDLKLSKDSFETTGESTSYKSIGVFIDNLKSSIFFDGQVNLTNSKTLTHDKTGRRTEFFEIKGTIQRFN